LAPTLGAPREIAWYPQASPFRKVFGGGGADLRGLVGKQRLPRRLVQELRTPARDHSQPRLGVPGGDSHQAPVAVHRLQIQIGMQLPLGHQALPEYPIVMLQQMRQGGLG
jgi:hypothetical protein